MSDAPIYMVEEDDPEMQRAVEKARRTFRFFFRELSWEKRRVVPGLDLASLKIAFTEREPADTGDAPEGEQMWINDVDFDGQYITGTLLNEPNWLTCVQQGDRVRVAPRRMTDWMYSIYGQVYGAYTVNMLRSRMDYDEQQEHDEAWGLEFGDPRRVRIVPDDYISEGSTTSPSDVGSYEHPMAVNMLDSLEQFVTNDPSVLTEPDENGFTVLHQMVLAGSPRCVELILRHGADPNQRAGNGLSSVKLAKSLGWREVAETLKSHGAR